MKRRLLFLMTAGFLAPGLCSVADKAPAASGPEPIVGRWTPPQKPKPKSQRVVVFRSNGTCYYYYPGVSSIGGKWKVSEKDHRKYEVVWGGGTREEDFRIGTDGKLRNKGGEIIAEKTAEK